jgi:hypothetical protein
MQSISEIIGKHNNKQTDLLSVVNTKLNLNQLVLVSLDNSYARAHCHFKSIEGRKLVLIADSPTWAAYLRYNQQDIINNLSSYSEFNTIDAIEIEIDASV